MKPILFNPDLPSERINRTAANPAALVAEICGQLMAGVTDIEELAQAIYSADLVEEFDKGSDDSYFADAIPYVHTVLELLLSLGFLSYYDKVSNEWEIQRPIALGESFTDYFEEKFKEEDDD